MKSIYNSSDNTLQEQPSMEEPEAPKLSYNSQAGFDAALKIIEVTYSEYSAHIASLRRIPCHDSCRGLWANGSVLEEYVDYAIRDESTVRNNEDGTQTKNPSSYLAFPLVPVKSEDELWYELMMDISGKFLIIQGDESHLKDIAAIDYLKEKFTLTKKQ